MQVFLDYEGLRAKGIRLSTVQLWRLWKTGRFPRPVKVSGNKNAWLEAEVDAYLASRIAERDALPTRAA